MMAFLFMQFEPGFLMLSAAPSQYFMEKPSAMMAFLFMQFEPGFFMLSAAPAQ
ncbi:hypothetical protein SXM_1630 [Shewanella xiamenensis]|nr:hypothetical protein SXM_1630 [Shewanella xiamenensis]